MLQNQTKCERSMQEMVSISGNCTYNEIIVVNHLASCWCAAHQQKAGNVTLGWQFSISSQLAGGGASNLTNYQLWFPQHPFSTTDWLKAQRTGQQRQRRWTSGSAEPGNVTLWWTHARAAGRSPKSHHSHHLRHHRQNHFHCCRHHHVSLFRNPTGQKLSFICKLS